MGSEHEDAGPAESVGREAHQAADRPAHHHGLQFVRLGVGGLHADQPGRQRHVGHHHDGDDHAHGDGEPPTAPAVDVQGGQSEHQPDHAAPAEDGRGVRPGPGECGPDLGLARIGDGKGEHGVQEIAGGRDDRHADDGGHQDPAVQRVERPSVEGVSLEVNHGGPDPHGRKDLDYREPPVGQDQLESFEQHGEGPDGYCERREDGPAPAQLNNRGLDHGIVTLADGAHQPADPGRQGRGARDRTGRRGAFPSRGRIGRGGPALPRVHLGRSRLPGRRIR